MDLVTALGGIGAAFGLATSAGLNAYIPLLVVALAARLPLADPWLNLAAPYNTLAEWWVIAVLVVLLAIEMLVDKIPAVDTVNDLIQTFIRPAAGALLFAANANVVTDLNPGLALLAGLVLAGGVHATKGTVRPAVTASTAGMGNWFVSLMEDIVAFVASLMALFIPIVIGVVALIAFALLVRRLWRRRQRRYVIQR